MKFYKSNPHGDHLKPPRVEVDAEAAVAHVINMSARGYDGALERAQAHADAAAELLGRLVAVLIDNGTLRTADDVAKVLQSSYVRAED